MRFSFELGAGDCAIKLVMAKLPRHRHLMNNKITDRAIAYLKSVMPNDSSPAVQVSQADNPVMLPFTDDLYICYVVDDGKTYQYIQERHLAEDGINKENLSRNGIRNLTEIISKRHLRVQPYQNIYGVRMGGDFEASLILIDQLWDRHFRPFVSGVYAIAIPARDILAFCDKSSIQGINELQQLIDRVTPRGDHLISERIWLRQDGGLISM
jgi:uncharacterized protein YtpQ (UPF0354 family)